MTAKRSSQKGYLMPMAIFILLVMGGMALTISRYTGQASVATIQEIMNVEAFYAAESGAQFGMNQLYFSSSQLVSQASVQGSCNSLTPSVTFTGAGLQNCTATLSCGYSVVSGASYFTLTSVGACGTGSLAATRSLEISSYVQ